MERQFDSSCVLGRVARWGRMSFSAGRRKEMRRGIEWGRGPHILAAALFLTIILDDDDDDAGLPK